MVCTAVLVIQVVGMFPYIEAQQRFQSGTPRVASVRFFGNVQFSLFVYRKPCPARAEQPCGGGIEFFLEVLKASEVPVDGFCQFTGRLMLAGFGGELKEI